MTLWDIAEESFEMVSVRKQVETTSVSAVTMIGMKRIRKRTRRLGMNEP